MNITDNPLKKKPNKKRRVYRNRTVMILSLVLAIVLSVLFLQEFVLGNLNHNNERVRGFYLEDENSIDVVTIGSSEVYCAFAPGLNYKECGFTSYPFATEGNTVRNFKAMYKEMMRTQDPKLIVIEINGALYSDKNIAREANLRRVSDNIPLNENKVELVDEWVTENKIEYYAPFIKYHGTWDKLPTTIGWTFTLLQERFRGYSLLKGVKNFNEIYVTGSKVYAKESSALKVRKPLFSEADKNLKEFLDFLKEEGVSRDKILFVRFPHVITNANLSRYQRGNTIGDTVRRYGYNFVSFEMDDEDINLDPYKDFYNIEHMNIYGQQKFSKFFAHYLQDNYDITPTSLTAKQKAEWDEAARWYDAYAAYNIDLIEKGEKKREISESYFIMQEIKKYLK